jgi:uncharacterized protein YcgL (UPF0745 family)
MRDIQTTVVTGCIFNHFGQMQFQLLFKIQKRQKLKKKNFEQSVATAVSVFCC